MNNLEERLVAIYNTLNLVEIKGEQNIQYMFGVLSTLKQILNEQQQITSEELL